MRRKGETFQLSIGAVVAARLISDCTLGRSFTRASMIVIPRFPVIHMSEGSRALNEPVGPGGLPGTLVLGIQDPEESQQTVGLRCWPLEN